MGEVMVSAFGVEASTSDWSKIAEIPLSTFQSRLRRYPAEVAIITPKGQRPDMMMLGSKYIDMRVKKLMEKYDKYMYEKRMAEILYEKAQEVRKKREEEEKRQKLIEDMSAKQEAPAKLIHMNQRYIATYFCMVNSYSGYWKTEVVTGKKLFKLLIGNHTVERWETWYGR